ncbi:NUDIX hydrolase N-terminal domain-containing protein [Fibrisoma limi]|uniref:NUDIX hydrolase N-terminal domain-containing protein n=1 Tax=Fibrisoma limi TaxID=663275 RepID=UPI0006872184|nr:NUDIX hydrolase N-terminal domain-containing protein [Fibrisoma limi]
MATQTKTILAQLSLIDQVRAIALEGLKYAKDSYDIDRYTKLLNLAALEYAGILNIDRDDLLKKFENEVGVVTPKLGSEAVVINSKGEILVLKRTDDQSWCLPCGWVDVGESPAQAAVRETKEETGLDVEANFYISISHKGPHTASHLQHQINIITFMKPVESSVNIILSREHTNYQWIKCGEFLNWHIGHDQQFEKICNFLKSNQNNCIFIT